MRYAVLFITFMATLNAQGLSDVRRLYDAGKYKEAVAAVEHASPDDNTVSRLLFLGGQSQEQLRNTDAARQLYQRLADGTNPAWAEIGRSALALLDKRMDDALTAANNGVSSGASLAEAHFQLGLVLLMRRENDEAADAFDKATSLDASYAAAHYYGGLADSRAKRTDRMAAHFSAFVKLAPDAPERLEVESIMRTVRGGR